MSADITWLQEVFSTLNPLERSIAEDAAFDSAIELLVAAGIDPADCGKDENGDWYCNDSRAATFTEFKLTEEQAQWLEVYKRFG